MDFLRGIGIFIEDLWPGILVGFAAGVGLLLALLVLTDAGFNEPDCAEAVLEARAEMVGDVLSSATAILYGSQLEIANLQAQLDAQSNGSGGDAGIRPNEELGAWSDAAGEFACFPVEGAGFPSG